MQPYVSVIIPSGRPEMVEETIQGLEKQDLGRNTFEVVVVTPVQKFQLSSSSVDVTILQVKQLFAPGRMRNLGAAKARGELLAFIDDDCIPPVHWLSTLVQTIDEGKSLAAVGCRVVGRKGYWNRCADYALFAAYQHNIRKICDLGSAAILVRASAFIEVGGFDQDLLASEDWEFSLRLSGHGWRCLFEPGVEVLHNHRCGSLVAICYKSYLYGMRSSLITQRRHREQMSLLARLSVAMGSPWVYWLLILPYSIVVSLFQGGEFFQTDRKVIMYFPIIFLSRCIYHIGVWQSLLPPGKISEEQA